MSRILSRTSWAIGAYALVVTSPATCTRPVVISVSTATRDDGSSRRSASRIVSLIWSAILSGWPSVTDSEVKRRRDTVSSSGWAVSCRTVGPTLTVATGVRLGNRYSAHVADRASRTVRVGGEPGPGPCPS